MIKLFVRALCCVRRSGRQFVIGGIALSVAFSWSAFGTTQPSQAEVPQPAAAKSTPQVTKLSQTLGLVKGGTRITITGKGFKKVKQVWFGALRGKKVKVLSATKLKVTVPPQDPQTVNVTVVAAGGQSATSASTRFRYQLPPRVSSLSMVSGDIVGGETLALFGVGLASATKVVVGDAPATILTRDDGRLEVLTPAHHGGAATIKVSTPVGKASSAKGLAFAFKANPRDPGAFELEILQLVNQARVVGGKCGSVRMAAAKPLRWDGLLGAVAASHSRDMADRDYFSHTNLAGLGPTGRLSAAGLSSGSTGENIGAGFTTAAAVMRQWLSSAGHCRNLLNPAFTRIGVGQASQPNSKYRYYWTQLFAG